VVPEGRANPRQLCIRKENRAEFQRLLEHILQNAREAHGAQFKPYTVLQLTHSGRYSKPTGTPAPVLVAQNPYLDARLPEDCRVISDGELEALEEKFAEAALLAKEIGFDAVDVKSCHRYLNSDLLSAFTRDGKYGGNFENRTRFLLNIVDKIRARAGDSLAVALRLNAYDAVPYPYGWGVCREDFHVPDLTEPLALVKLLREKGVKLFNISCGNPYYNPHVGRPYNAGPYTPPRHPLEDAAVMLNAAREVQAAVPDAVGTSTGFSWLRQFGANAAAGGIEAGWFKLAGFGRQAFAYPDFARDILENGGMKREKCCTAFGNCTVIMRDGGKTGCVPKDPAVYAPIFQKGRLGQPPQDGSKIAEHI
jgi:2,4-dienoyl-CoA reductase-like NADH-dependent reductase (Old Yellow Enzyme family)